MNKAEIIEKLNKYNLNKKEVTIISGAALVLHGIIAKTNDIDICVTKNYYNFLINNYNCICDKTNVIGEKNIYTR